MSCYYLNEVGFLPRRTQLELNAMGKHILADNKKAATIGNKPESDICFQNKTQEKASCISEVFIKPTTSLLAT